MKSGEEPGQLSTSTIASDSVDGIITRSVRFNGFVEVNTIYWSLLNLIHIILHIIFVQVRELSPNEAVDALMARLSYSASIRAEVATRRCAEKLSALETMKVAATFSLLVVHYRWLYVFFSWIIMWCISSLYSFSVVFRKLQLPGCSISHWSRPCQRSFFKQFSLYTRFGCLFAVRFKWPLHFDEIHSSHF